MQCLAALIKPLTGDQAKDKQLFAFKFNSEIYADFQVFAVKFFT